jgi:uncharacterized YigZ family protein
MKTEMEDAYRSLFKPATGLVKEKGSKFMGYAYPIVDENDAKKQLEAVKAVHPGARHFCYAWKLGATDNLYRVNDDGEPSGSAGLPILGQIRSFDITNVLLVVVRYFGGTKLGLPGLKNAYKAAAADTLGQAKLGKKFRKDTLSITFDYVAMNEVMSMLKATNAEILEQEFDSRCVLHFRIRQKESASIQEHLAKINTVLVTRVLREQ